MPLQTENDPGITATLDKTRAIRQGGNLSGVLFELFSRLLAAALILCLAPLFLLVSLTLKARLGPGPLFYQGVRLGRDKREFVMYKFRTLPENAQGKIGSELFSNRFGMLTPLTNFLRETRIDELPQLLNVLKRDMDFFGPRPVRPEVYRDRCRMIPNYDLRFSVRPGLIGYSQLYTPHSAPKRLRAYIDNRFVSRQRGTSAELKLLVASIRALLFRLVRRIRTSCRTFVQIRLMRRYSEKRSLERVPLGAASALLILSEERTIRARIVDINEKCFQIVSNVDLPEELPHIRLQISTLRNGRIKKKRAFCSGRLVAGAADNRLSQGRVYVIEYRADSPLNDYVITQYFLHQSIA